MIPITVIRDDMIRDTFESFISESIDGLPESIQRKLHNVTFAVEAWPSEHDLLSAKLRPGMTLFGLYQGIPQTKRGNYSGALPDRITIFAGPILSKFGNNRMAVKNQVRKTVLHEIGHHFGMSEEEIREAF